jgi:hypothetical protein
MSNNSAVILVTENGIYMFHGSLVLKLTPKGPVPVDPDMIAPRVRDNIMQLAKATELYQNIGDAKEFENIRTEAAAIITSKAEALRKTVKNF